MENRAAQNKGHQAIIANQASSVSQNEQEGRPLRSVTRAGIKPGRLFQPSPQPAPQHSLFVAIGLDAGEPGHARIAETVQSLGSCTPYHESLWRVNCPHDLDKAFKQINTSMIDRRIDGTAGLLMLNPNEGHVKWHLRRPFSELLKGCWHQRNNLFISFTLRDPAASYERVVGDVLALGMSAPIGKSIWYSSSTYSSKEAFRILISSMDPGDELMVFDEKGNVALWHDGHSSAAQAYRQQAYGHSLAA